MSTEPDSVRAKVLDLFKAMSPDRAQRLDGTQLATGAMDAIAEAFTGSLDATTAQDIGFHLADWNWDAAFIVALHLHPERFAPAEIRDGVYRVLTHVPGHLLAATKLVGLPITDLSDSGERPDDATG